MRIKSLIIFSLLSLAFQTINAAETKTKKKPNIQVFENDSNESTFSARVKLVRETQGETDVFFDSEKNRGPYTLPSNSKNFNEYKSRLIKSQKAGGSSVKITVDDKEQIQNVETEEGSANNTLPIFED